MKRILAAAVHVAHELDGRLVRDLRAPAIPQSVDLLVLPTSNRAADENAAPLVMPNVEDLHVAERIKRALRTTGYGALRAVEVSVIARFVRLVGRVPSYYLKQIAQATALAIPGVHQIHNGLEVVRPT